MGPCIVSALENLRLHALSLCQCSALAGKLKSCACMHHVKNRLADREFGTLNSLFFTLCIFSLSANDSAVPQHIMAQTEYSECHAIS